MIKTLLCYIRYQLNSQYSYAISTSMVEIKTEKKNMIFSTATGKLKIIKNNKPISDHMLKQRGDHWAALHGHPCPCECLKGFDGKFS